MLALVVVTCTVCVHVCVCVMELDNYTVGPYTQFSQGFNARSMQAVMAYVPCTNSACKLPVSQANLCALAYKLA